MRNLLSPAHEIVSGMIGMGKSYYVLSKILRSFEVDQPLCYIDPKGDTYRNLLAYMCHTEHGRELWRKYRHRIILVNPVSKSDHIVGFNALKELRDFHNQTVDPVALTAQSVVSHIRHQSGFSMDMANRMQNIMAAAIGLLVDGGDGEYTMSEIPLLFRQTYSRKRGRKKASADDHNPFVSRLLQHGHHFATTSFWYDQWANWSVRERKRWVQSTEGRIFQYLFNDQMLYTVCTVEHDALDFVDVIDKGYWLFVNIPYQFLDEVITTLLGNLLITRLHYAAMQREPTSDYRIILDEARFFNSGPLRRIFETSRAYRLWMTLVVQNLDQMCRRASGNIDYGLRDTALNEARYFSIFRSTADRETFADIIFPPTGEMVRGKRVSGDIDYYPVSAERAQNEYVFMKLAKRQMLFHDKEGAIPTRFWMTRRVQVPEVPPEDIDLFEGYHLRTIGTPSSEIEGEISERQNRIRNLIDPDREPTKQKATLRLPKIGEPL